MKIRIQDGLPYITTALNYRGRQLVFEKVILDTGSTGTIFTADKLADIGLLPEPQDAIHRVWGVRGTEFVFMNHGWSDHLKQDTHVVDRPSTSTIRTVTGPSESPST